MRSPTSENLGKEEIYTGHPIDKKTLQNNLKKTYMEKNANRMASTDGIVKLREVSLKCIWISCFYYIHAHPVQCFNGFVDGPIFPVVVHVVEPKCKICMSNYKQTGLCNNKNQLAEMQRLCFCAYNNNHAKQICPLLA